MIVHDFTSGFGLPPVFEVRYGLDGSVEFRAGSRKQAAKQIKKLVKKYGGSPLMFDVVEIRR